MIISLINLQRDSFYVPTVQPIIIEISGHFILDQDMQVLYYEVNS